LEKLEEVIDLNQYSKIGILTDELIGKHFIPIIKKGLKREVSEIIIQSGEKEKNIETFQYILEKLFKEQFDRKSLLINLGGGVIGDLGGFVAGCFMRGISFLQVPTTLLSQVDASIGDKVGINFVGIKNGIGLFNPPVGVIIDVHTLSTLPRREFLSGFSEIIKHGIIADKKYFEFVTSKKPAEFSKKELVSIIKRSCEIKASIVEADEKETGFRKTLNFGHTIGHAIEELKLETNALLHHGEAVAIGMVAESKLAELLGMFNKHDLEKIKKGIIRAGLPTSISNISTEKMMDKMLSDKKNRNGKILWSLPEKIGSAKFNIEASEQLIINAIKQILL